MRSLYWLRADLRLTDNPALEALSNSERLLLVYVRPDNPAWCNVHGIGEQRARFIAESLKALREELRQRGQNVLVVEGFPEKSIPSLVKDYRIDQVVTSYVPGSYERKSLNALTRRLAVPVTVVRGNTLFSEEDIADTLATLPGQFTPFRKQVEGAGFSAPRESIDSLPPPPVIRFDRLSHASIAPHPALAIRGGSPSGEQRLRQFVWGEKGIQTYKETRNGLDALEGSSTLSPWLANGNLSVRQVASEIRRFESAYGANESTQWLYLELLWREYFFWRAKRDGDSLFQRNPPGSRRRLHACTFEPRSFARWCQGDTDYPLVNALMRQMVATGWMSNRGRQIAASCLIYELGLDWRYGAAFFEKHLIDYDVASNYGNWQYLAGVGADPRGGRHFDLQRQAEQFDPEGAFTEKWGGNRPAQPKYVTDAADWPIVEEEG